MRLCDELLQDAIDLHQQMTKSIRELGPTQCVLATDFGRLHHPIPPEGLRMSVQMLIEQGIAPDDIGR